MHKSRIQLIIISAFLVIIFISLLYQAQAQDRREAAAGPALGVGIVDLPPGTAQQGVRVQTVVPGSLADIAGIKPGDIITTLNNTAVTSMRQFMRLAAVQGNTAYPLGIVHEGLPRTIMIGAGGTSVAGGPAAMGPILGLVIKDIPPVSNFSTAGPFRMRFYANFTMCRSPRSIWIFAMWRPIHCSAIIFFARISCSRPSAPARRSGNA